MSKKIQIALFYLNNISGHKIGKKESEEILEYTEQNSLDLFGFNVMKKWGSAFEERRLRAGGKPIQFELERNFKSMRKILADKKIQNIYAPGYDPTIDAIIQTFKLQHIHRHILTLIVNAFKYPMIRKLVNELFSINRYGEFNKTELEPFATLCKMSIKSVEKALDISSPLFSTGILSIAHDGDFSLSKRFQQLLVGSRADNPEKVLRCLLRNASPAKLSTDNFSHVIDEYSYVKSILDNAIKQDTMGINILLYGPVGTGKTEFAKTIAKDLRRPLYEMGGYVGKQKKESGLQDLGCAQRLLRQDKNAILLLDEAEDVFRYNELSDDAPSKLSLNRTLEKNRRPVIWISNSVRCIDPAFLRRFTYCLELKRPKESARIEILSEICKKYKVKMPKEKIAELAERHNVPPSIYETAVRNARITKNPEAIERTICSLHKAITGEDKLNADKNMAADKTPFSTALLNTDTDLAQLTARISDKKLRRFSLCLYGTPGTGKSAYARYLADKLKMPVIQKRASDMKSKYVGETEQNIAAAFAEAKDKNAILVFDEADSFLQDRSDAQRSWEISSVNEMLTQMEKADFPFICTTNLMTRLDKAAMRRFTFKVKYEYLTPEQVADAFRHFFGATSDVDLGRLTHLAPGDFTVVKNKSEILGITEHAELVRMLAGEMEAKGEKQRNKIGF